MDNDKEEFASAARLEEEKCIKKCKQSERD